MPATAAASNADGGHALLLTRDEAEHRRRGETLAALLAHQEFADVTLVLSAVDNNDNGDGSGGVSVVAPQTEEVAAHRVVLAASSDFFRALFTSGMSESRAARVVLPGVNAHAFRLLLRYMYAGELALAGDTVLPVLEAADRLEMPAVVDACCAQLLRRLSVDNCIDVFLFTRALAHRRACRMLARAARAFMRAFAVQVRGSAAFQRALLRSDASVLDVVGDTSRRRLVAVRKESGGDCCDGSASIGALPTASPTADASSTAGPAGCRVVSSQKEDASALRPPSPVSMVPPSPCDDGREQRDQIPVIFAIGGFNGPCALKSVELLDFHSGTWFAAASMGQKRSHAGAAVSDAQHIYVLGGTCNARHLTSAERFDPERNAWTPVPSMPTARSYLGAAFLGGCVYAVGGFNGVSHLRAVERFSVDKQRWEAVAPLLVPRSGLALVAVRGQLVAVGGFDGREHLSSAEVYDPRANQWRLAPKMAVARNGPAAVACNRSNSVIVFGGESNHGEPTSSSEALALEPEMEPSSSSADDVLEGDTERERDGGAEDKWTEYAPFADARSGHAALAFLDESFMFALGGSKRKDEHLNVVHRFDFVSRAWTPHSRMRVRRCGLSAAVAHVSAHAKCLDAQRATEALRGPQ